MCHIVAHFSFLPMIVNIDSTAGDEKIISAKRECKSDIYSRFIFNIYVLFMRF